LLDREVTVLAERLRHWRYSRWTAAAPPFERRSDAAFALASRLAELAGAPVPLSRVADHVIPDQIAVTGRDLVRARPDEPVLREALAEIQRTRELLGVA
jgi:hypothetical protein